MVELTALAGYSIEMRPTQSVFILLQRCGERDFSVNPSEKKLRDQCHHLFHREARGPVSQE